MITTYHRPQTLDEALTLLAQPNTLPLGGGTLLSHPTADSVSVVDLQALGLNGITRKGNDIELGATVTLQQLLESEHCPEALQTAIKLEAPLNLRNSATLAGTLVSSNGRSPFAAALLALDAKIAIQGSSAIASPLGTVMGMGEFLPLRPKGLITAITIPAISKFAFEYTSRTPADKPLVSAALAQWPSGRSRLVIGGFGKSPSLAMDGELPPSPSGRGTEGEGLFAAARNACHEAADDFASADYRMDVAATLAKRCLEGLK
jgi:CO/xanthine dehydrogenase FAD-binding subunit